LEKGPEDTFGGKAAVGVKVLVFDGDNCLFDVRGKIGEFD